MTYFYVYSAGFLTLIILGMFYRVFGGLKKISDLWNGTDNRPSTSIFQFALWTMCAFFSYTVVFAARMACNLSVPITEIPYNLLTAMGLSAATAAAAKGITMGYLGTGSVDKSPTPQAPGAAQPAIPNHQYLLTDDSGKPDLSKLQLVGWTFISLGVYLISVVVRVHSMLSPQDAPAGPTDVGLPDIDTALMVLMGISQGAYVGKKLVTTTTPRLTGVSPSSIPAVGPTTVTLTGISFGDGTGDQILLNGMPYTGVPTPWTDTSIQFVWPANQPSGTPWAAGQPIQISLIANGQFSNSIPVVCS